MGMSYCILPASHNSVVSLHAPRIDHTASDAGLRTVAAFEALKGALVLIVGLGGLTFLHRDLDEFAEHLLRFLHLNPEGHRAQVFLDAAARVTDRQLWILAAGALAYSTVRLIEAYGLWHRRVWAEWFAIISGGLYIPVELYELIHRPRHIKAVILMVNVAIVAYLIYIRGLSIKRHREQKRAAAV